MGTEIERKFLLQGEAWREGASGLDYRQGYLSTDKQRTVRVRVVGARAMLTIKGMTHGIRRVEFEYPIPQDDAEQLLALCHRPLIEKTRYRVEHAGLVWEIDEFHGENAGLLVAEVELEDESQAIQLPAWVGEEVSDDPRYFNSNLARHPYSEWRDEAG
ncbi:MAG: CYTH domain-containing protein [Gammaproteobacteria bacterium]|nr:CYTH domain-containing protein [Gammaproteobacteria bacterium]